MKRSFIREILEARNENSISFAGGLPDESLFPLKALQTCAKKVLENPKSLQYSASMGILELREMIARRYCKKGFETSTREIMITTGSQQALNLIAQGYLDKEVALEAPTYLGALGVFKMHAIACKQMRLDKEGLVLEDLRKTLKTSKALYLIPDFQNPSALRYSEKRRKEVASLCQEAGALLIEDAAYEELYFDKSARAIASYMPERSFHMGSFSKILARGLRVGWIRCSESLMKKILPIKEVMDLHTSSLDQMLILEYLKTNTLETHLEKLRRAYKKKMLIFAHGLKTELSAFEFDHPEGGMFIYGKLKGISTSSLVKACMKRDVLMVPGIEFYASRGCDDEIRFNFTSASEVQIIKGLKIINKEVLALKEYSK